MRRLIYIFWDLLVWLSLGILELVDFPVFIMHVIIVQVKNVMFTCNCVLFGCYNCVFLMSCCEDDRFWAGVIVFLVFDLSEVLCE